MAGETFTLDDAYAPAATQQSAQPQAPAAVFTDTGEPGSAAQQAFYRGLSHGTADYTQAPKGSRNNPYGLRSGEAPPSGSYYVDLAGHLHEPDVGTAPAAAPAPLQAPLPSPQTLSAPAPQASATTPPNSDAFSLDEAYQGSPAGPDTRPVSEKLGFIEGVTKPLDNVAGWLNKIMPDDALAHALGMKATSEANADRQKAFTEAEKTQKPGELGKVGGSIVGTLPTLMLPGGAIAQGAAAGASLTDHPDDPLRVAEDAVGGAVGAKVGGVALSAIGKAASPVVRPAVQTLMKYGMKDFTPGQIVGGLPQRVEDASTSIFGLGDAIKTGQRRSLTDFNRAAWNSALGEFGEKLPDSVNVGRSAASYATDAFDRGYGAIKPQIRADVDIPLVKGVGTIRTDLQNLAPDHVALFDDVFKKSILRRMGPSGELDGQAFKDADTELGQEIASVKASPAPRDQAYVKSLQALKDELTGSLSRNSSPEAAAKYADLQRGYAKFARLRAAAANPAAKDGLFTAGHLSQAVLAADKSVGKGDFARGDAMLQDLADAGKDVLPSTVPDSGTAMRAFLGELPMLVGFGAESQHFLPQLATAGIVSGIPSLAYIGPGSRIAQAALTRRPWTAAQAARALQWARPAVSDISAVGGESAAKKLPQLPAPAR